jgi:hypothetical protein
MIELRTTDLPEPVSPAIRVVPIRNPPACNVGRTPGNGYRGMRLQTKVDAEAPLSMPPAVRARELAIAATATTARPHNFALMENGVEDLVYPQVWLVLFAGPGVGSQLCPVAFGLAS